MNHLEATKGPKGAQLEDISALDGLTPMAAQAWRASEGKMDRRRRLNVSIAVIAVLVTIAALRWVPEGWGGDPMPVRIARLGVAVAFVAIGAVDLLAQLRLSLWAL